MECQSCAFNPIVQAVSALLQTTTVVIDRKNTPLNAVEYFVHRHKVTNPKVSKAAQALVPGFAKLKAFVESDLLPKCQDVCLTCSKNSDDDNLSHGGQTFVFMEAMPGAAGELAGGNGGRKDADGEPEGQEGPDTAQIDADRAFFEDDEDETSACKGNWLNAHAVIPTRTGSGAGGVTQLPTGVENDLRYILSCFKELTTLQQCVLLQRWKEMSFVDIGSMTWVPEEFRRHNDKQLVSFWWKSIVRKFPWAAGLSGKKKAKDGKGGVEAEDDYKTHSPSEIYCEQELDFGEGGL